MSTTLTLSVDQRERALLAPWAMSSRASAGRLHPEPPHPYRSPFQRDRDRITHCAAFRRLSHKTQVFTGDLGDYHRSRLTHTLEVASIARTLARALALNEDLVEALALLHDIGHPPFGHAGEDVLDERLAHHGGFSHNRQAWRSVERLEIRYPEFAGLNLSHEVLEGQLIRSHKHTSPGEESPLLEVQVVDVADSIAYDAHDADDALELRLLGADDLMEVSLWREATGRLRERYANLNEGELRRAVIHELIDTEVGAVLAATEQQIHERGIASVDDVRQAPRLVVLPEELRQQKQELKSFLFSRVYRHPTVLAHREVATRELATLFDHFQSHPDQLPLPYSLVAEEEGISRAAGDFVSSFTDRSARDAFARL
jgi:dGTPase